MFKTLNFDHAASTTVRPEVWTAVQSLADQSLSNPSSIHALGRQSRGLIDQARLELAELTLGKPEEVIFTSGATEALVTAIVGSYLALPKKRGVVYTSPLVHSCVWAGLNFLQNQYAVEVKTLPLDPSGFVDLEAIGSEILGEADIIVCEHLNSETGHLQPVAKLGKKLIRWAEENDKLKPILVVDAAASAVTELVGLEFQKCDFLAFSGEKIGGLSGTGVLLKRSGVRLESLIGGSQEWGYRGGTENIVGIAAMLAAYKAHHRSLESQKKKMETLKAELRSFLDQDFPQYKVITPAEGSGAHILTVLSPDTPASLLVTQADLAGVALSAGSACSSGSVTGSKVLQALGVTEEASFNGLRFSWGWNTTRADLEKLKIGLKQIL